MLSCGDFYQEIPALKVKLYCIVGHASESILEAEKKEVKVDLQ